MGFQNGVANSRTYDVKFQNNGNKVNTLHDSTLEGSHTQRIQSQDDFGHLPAHTGSQKTDEKCLKILQEMTTNMELYTQPNYPFRVRISSYLRQFLKMSPFDLEQYIEQYSYQKDMSTYQSLQPHLEKGLWLCNQVNGDKKRSYCIIQATPE